MEIFVDLNLTMPIHSTLMPRVSRGFKLLLKHTYMMKHTLEPNKSSPSSSRKMFPGSGASDADGDKSLLMIDFTNESSISSSGDKPAFSFL